MAKVKGKAVLLIVGGSKVEHEAAETRACALGAGGRIKYIEKVPPRDVPRYISAADVLVSPRISGTNTPLKIYSFLKSGKPFVATRLYTHTQVLTDEMVILADPTPQGMAAGLDFALGSEEARRRARDSKLRADAEYVYPRYLEKITQALFMAVGRA